MGLVTEFSLGGYRGGAEARNTLNSCAQKQKSGTVKFEPRVHSAISAGLRGVSPCRIRVLRASLAAAAAAARAAARH
jgi:hypothetical protein